MQPGIRWLALWLCGAALPLAAQNAITPGALATQGNLHTGGLVLDVSGDVDRDASAMLEWRVTGQPAFRAAHPLVRVDATHFVGSLFKLAPGTSHDTRVTVSDPDGVIGAPLVSAALATRADTLVEPTLRTLNVSTLGNDGNTGLGPGAGQALRTVQRAAQLSAAGDVILIAAGVYRESVDVTTSGTAAQPIVFRGVGAATVLDGADPTIFSGVAWSAQGNGVFAYTPPAGFATGHATTELGRLFRYGSLVELQALAAGFPGGFWFSGGTLRVKFADSSNPATHTLHVAREEDGFFLDGVDYVRIENLAIRHYGAGDFGKGVYFRYADDSVARNLLLSENGAAGVWLKGGSRNRVEFNTITDTSIPNWPWDETKGSSAENNGITFTDDIGRGNVLRGNVISGTFNGIGPCGSLPPPAGFSNETDAYDNVLSAHNDDAFEPEGHCSNVRIFGNRIRDVHMAFAVAPAAIGPTWILRNTAYDFGRTRTSQIDGYVASSIKINSGFAQAIGPMLVYQNTLLTTAPATEAIALLPTSTATGIILRNNILAGTRYVIERGTLPNVVWSQNHDLLHTTDATRFVRWQGTQYATLSAFFAGTGHEANGVAAPPNLFNPASGDFTPNAGSAAIDAGVVLPGINDDYVGSGPDIGAFEVSPVLFANGFEG